MRVATLARPTRILIPLIAAAALVPILLTPLTPEVASTLAVSRRLLEGAHLYRDVIDYAPPLIFLLGMPIEALAIATGWPEWPLVATACAGLCVIALLLIRRIARPDPEPLLLVTLVGAVAMLLASPARDFGQAEHLVVILLAPYVLWCARLAGEEDADLPRPVRLAIGLLAWAGMAIAPLCYFVYLTLIAYLVWSRRSVRVVRATEHVVVAGGMAVYAVAILIFMPEYVQHVLPMAYLQYWTHGGPIRPMLGDWMVWSVGGSSLLMALLAPWLTRGREWSTLVRACALASLAMFAVFVLQRDSAPVHFLPVRAYNFLAAWFAAAGFITRLARPPVTAAAAGRVRQTLALAMRTGAVTLAVVPPLMVCSLVFEVQSVDYANAQAGLRSPYADPLLDLVHQRAAGKPIFVLSSSTGPAFPLVNLTEATWPYRFKSLSFVSIYYRDDDNPATVRYHAPQAQSAEERAFFDDVVDDLTRRPPALLIVDVTRLKQGFGLAYFDFLTYYRQSPAFGALLQHYRMIDWKKNFQVFEYQPPS